MDSERLYQAYRTDRDDGLSHAQIVAQGVYGADVEDFALRYSLACAAYADAMIRRRSDERFQGSDGDFGSAPDARPLPRAAR